MATGELFERKEYTEGEFTSNFKLYNWAESNNAIILWADVESGGTGSFSVALEDSPDGRNWAHVSTPIASANMTSTTLVRGTVSSTTYFGGQVRFKLTLQHTGASGTMAVFAHFRTR